MKLFKKFGPFIFWVILILDCLLIDISKQQYRVFTKPLLMPVLALIFWVSTRRSRHYSKKTLVYTALALFAVADFLSLKNSSINILIITAAGYAVYTFIISKMSKINVKDCQEAFLTLLGVLVITAITYKLLIMGSMQPSNISFFICMGVLIFMLPLAANVFKDKIKKNIAYSQFIPASIILLISMLISFAERYLLKDTEAIPTAIMFTYGFGQLLMIRGMIRYLKG